jgi:hypothetical protein
VGRVPILPDRASAHIPTLSSSSSSPQLAIPPTTLSTATMDGIQLRDEAAQDRVRAAIEFLDPSKFPRLMHSPYSI